MTAFAAACQHPFANGTEGRAWEACWCEVCEHDHGMSHGPENETGEGCDLIALIDEWPEGWLPEPDDGMFHLPSRLVCLRFKACEACGGDPGALDRAERVASVTTYWMERGT